MGAVLAVAPYGQTPDMAAWQKFRTDTNIPVVVDAAASFDTLAGFAPDVPVVVSLHATKTLSSAEGGFILAGDPGLIDRCTRALNFGFFDGRNSVGPSINGKLSEYHAAVGLADLDGWESKRSGFRRVAENYLRAAAQARLAGTLFADAARANPYVLYLAPPGEAAEALCAWLHDNGIDTRRWYGGGIHRQTEFAACPRLALPVTDDLAPRLIGLPVAVDMDDAAISRVVAALRGCPSA